jgi:hypothetical protein
MSPAVGYLASFLAGRGHGGLTSPDSREITSRSERGGIPERRSAGGTGTASYLRFGRLATGRA